MKLKMKLGNGMKTLVIFLAIFFIANTLFFSQPKKASAYLSFDAVDVIFDIWSEIQAYLNTATNYLTTAYEKYEDYMSKYEAQMLPYLKKLNTTLINNETIKILTEGNNGKPYIITDWKSYLYKDPQNKALLTTTSLINQTLQGRASSSGYSNSEYYTYLKKQAINYITPQSIKTNLTTYTPDPIGNLFGSGNMMAFDALLKPGNNVFSFTTSVAEKLKTETEKEVTIAKEQTTNGFLPKKNAQGQIMTPASSFENSLQTASNMASSLTTNATKSGELASSIINAITQYAFGSLKDGLLGS